MKHPWLLVPVALLVAPGCSTQATYTVPAIGMGSPAGVSTLGFLDILAILPGSLGSAYPGCMMSTTAGSTVTLAFNACPSGSGGTQSGLLAIAANSANGPNNTTIQTYTETFQGLTTTLGPTLQWTLAGVLTVTVASGAQSVADKPGFQLNVTDTGTPSNSRAWTFTCGLTSAGTGGNLTLNGNYGFADGLDDVTVQIDPGLPLVWNGGRHPVSGTLHISDTRAGAGAPQTVDAVFSPGRVNIGGGNVTLPGS